MSRFVRASKYRYAVQLSNEPALTSVLHSHVFGQPSKKEHGIENVKVTNSAWDTNVISASGVKYLAV